VLINADACLYPLYNDLTYEYLQLYGIQSTKLAFYEWQFYLTKVSSISLWANVPLNYTAAQNKKSLMLKPLRAQASESVLWINALSWYFISIWPGNWIGDSDGIT
jgi:hypothetical protein